jgi:signal transduction histidine kinase
VAITNEGEILGELRLLAERDDHFTSADERLLTRVAGTLGPVLRNAALTRDLEAHITELRASRRRLVSAQDEARRTLERDIHDGAQQELLALRLSLGLAQAFADQGDLERTRTVLGEAGARTDVAIRSLRELARGLHPPILAEQGLAAALHARARSVPLPVTIDTDGIGRFDHDVEGAAYFCCVEAMQNATKHAAASRLGIELAVGDGQLRFTVADDGAGFVTATTERGAGLTNMVDRVEGLGGSLVVASEPGAGTTVTGTIPVTVQSALSDR